jgi:outer membrane autotransporter protein
MPGNDPSAPGRWRAWGLGFGATQSVDGDASAGTSHSSAQIAGGSIGVDRQFANGLLLGFSAGGSRSNFSAGDVATTGKADTGFFGLYGVKSLGPAYIAATLNYGRADNSTQRTITGGVPTEIANGSFASDQFGGRFEVGWKHALGGYSVTPFAAVEPAVLWQHAYTETSKTLGGAPGVKGLSYDANTVTSLPVFLGAQFDTKFALPYGQTLSPFVRASWVHEFKPDRSIGASFNILPGATFGVDGTRAASDLARIETGATLALTRNAALFANATGEFSEHSRSYAGMFGAKVSW